MCIKKKREAIMTRKTTHTQTRKIKKQRTTAYSNPNTKLDYKIQLETDIKTIHYTTQNTRNRPRKKAHMVQKPKAT